MQFAFSYMYFMMQEPTGESHETFLENSIDLDKNGYVNAGELRVLATYLFSGEIKSPDMNELFWRALDDEMIAEDKDKKAEDKKTGMDIFKLFLNDAPAGRYAKLKEKQLYGSLESKPRESVLSQRRSAVEEVGENGGLSIQQVVGSKWITDKLEKALENVPKYKHEMGDGNQVAFHMVGDSAEEVHKQVDSIWRNRPYFVCINDNMNKTGPNPEVIHILHEFYTTLLPEPSQFELPEGEHNTFLHLEEMPADFAEHDFAKHKKTASSTREVPWRLMGEIGAGLVLSVCLLWCLCRTVGGRNRKRLGRFSKVMNEV